MTTKKEASYKTSQKQIAGTYKTFKVEIGASQSVLDYGCGKYDELLTEYHRANNINGTLYEPYKENINTKPKGKFETVLCNNVLNVIESDDVLMSIILDVITYASKTAIFKVYKGKGDGAGKATKIGTFQRNTGAKGYAKYFEGLDYKIKGDFIIIRK